LPKAFLHFSIVSPSPKLPKSNVTFQELSNQFCSVRWTFIRAIRIFPDITDTRRPARHAVGKAGLDRLTHLDFLGHPVDAY
jgi:hypothetical protein